MGLNTKRSTIDMVEEFHDAFGIEVPIFPTIPDKKTCLVRLQLIQEELAELAHGLAAGDLVECLDALTDLQYVLDGTYLCLGLKDAKEAGVAEVHRSNMTKLDELGCPIINEAGRVVKGPNFEPPELSNIVRNLELPR